MAHRIARHLAESLAAVALVVNTPLAAQQPARRSAQVVLLGSVLTPTRQPAKGVVLSVGKLGPRDTTNARGRARLVLAHSGSTRILALCRSVTYFHARVLASVMVNSTRPDTLRVTMTVDPTLCTEPAVDTLTSDFRGHWSMGFEESSFVPCPSSLPGAHGAHQDELSRIWAYVVPGTTAWDSTRPAPAADTSGYADRYFVHVRGRLHGPGDFGHLGMAAYQLDVTDVLDIRTPAAEDCDDRPPPVYLKWWDSVVTVASPTLLVVRGAEESADLVPRAHRVGPGLGWVVVERGYDAAWMRTTDRMTVGPFHPRRLGYTLLTPGARPRWILDGEITSDAALAEALAAYARAARDSSRGGARNER